MTGWIKISRAIRDHWIYKDPVTFQWFFDLIADANYEDRTIRAGNHLITIKRGQLVASSSYLQKKWGRSRTMVENFLKMLQTDGMITKVVKHNVSIIEITNFNKYQSTNRAPLEADVTDDDTTTYEDAECYFEAPLEAPPRAPLEAPLEEKEKFPPCTPFIKEKEIYKEKEEEVVVVDARTHVREGATLDLRPYQARLEGIAMSCHLHPMELGQCIQEFNIHLEAKGKRYTEPSAYLDHLYNWILTKQNNHATNHHSTTREQRYASGANLINGLLAYAHNNKSGGANVSDEVYPF